MDSYPKLIGDLICKLNAAISARTLSSHPRSYATHLPIALFKSNLKIPWLCAGMNSVFRRQTKHVNLYFILLFRMTSSVPSSATTMSEIHFFYGCHHTGVLRICMCTIYLCPRCQMEYILVNSCDCAASPPQCIKHANWNRKSRRLGTHA